MNIIIGLLLFFGTFFFFIGVVGLLRLPDVYARMHATTKCDTLGAGLLLLALVLAQPVTISTLKIIFIIAFIWITHPTAAHIIARASYHTNTPYAQGTDFIDASKGDSEQ